MGKTENSENSVSLASEMQKTRKTAFRLQATDKKQRKLAFARKRNAKNGKNSVSLVSEEQKTVKTARRLCFFLKRLTFKIKKQ